MPRFILVFLRPRQARLNRSEFSGRAVFQAILNFHGYQDFDLSMASFS
jgi:hypothetical protein